MNIKKLKVNAASLGLSVALSSSYAIAAAQPVFAEEMNEEMPTEEVMYEEDAPEVTGEVVVEEPTPEVVVEETTPEVVVEEVVPEEVVLEEVPVQEEQVEEVLVQETTEEVKEEVQEEQVEEVLAQETTEEVKEEVQEEAVLEENQAEVLEKTEEEEIVPMRALVENNEVANEPHKVSVITTKVDKDGNPLVGATLQIIDSEGNVLDEWVSNGEEHISMLPEGDYILREISAPVGYIASADQTFNVKVEIKDINADVEHDDSHDVCWHYGGVALYYIESEGVRDEVYCINQNWDEPHGISYDGLVLNQDNIRLFTPDSDKTMTDAELYDKVLDIIYHRSKVQELFPELNESAIRMITEYALKTYTSAEVSSPQAMRDENGKIVRDEDGNIVYEDFYFLDYYRYDPNDPKGYVEDKGNGDGLGKLAQHWWTSHNHTKIPEEYAALFYYLISEEDKHPDDMFLYVYSTKNLTADGESYQNLLGVRWFDPYDEDYKTYLTVINEKDITPPPEEPEKPPVEPEKPPVEPEKPEEPPVEVVKHVSPNTGDESNLFAYSMSLLGSVGALGILIKKRKEYEKTI